jgi:hypothetical protein
MRSKYSLCHSSCETMTMVCCLSRLICLNRSNTILLDEKGEVIYVIGTGIDRTGESPGN